jgi:recombination protein RecR
MLLPESIQTMINALSRLPGVGPKTASRLTFYLLKNNDSLAEDLAAALQDLKSSITYCGHCHNITSQGKGLCRVCEHPHRTPTQVCVVEDPLDVLALERTGGYQGQYHVLQGLISPIEGVGPEDLNIDTLIARVEAENVEELILATNPSMEGDATAMFIQQQFEGLPVRVTRLARGLPVGGDLEYADQNTLLRALAGRQEMK